MTLTIAARCVRTGQLGAAGLLPTPAVAHLTLHARAGLGAAVLQSMINPYLAEDAFIEFAREHDAEQALHVVMANDPGRHLRQCALVDAQGRAAGWTGDDTVGWSGHFLSDNVALQGSRMAGPTVLKQIFDHFEAGAEQPLPERLLQALEVLAPADDADERGIVAAALLVVDEEDYAVCDARIDRSSQPVADLRALYDDLAVTVLPRIEKLPTRDDPLGQLARESSDGLA